MPEFVEIEHEGIEGTALVPETALDHHKQAGWKPVPKKRSAVNAAADKKE